MFEGEEEDEKRRRWEDLSFSFFNIERLPSECGVLGLHIIVFLNNSQATETFGPLTCRDGQVTGMKIQISSIRFKKQFSEVKVFRQHLIPERSSSISI